MQREIEYFAGISKEVFGVTYNNLGGCLGNGRINWWCTGANQLYSRLEIITIFFPNCGWSRIKSNNSRLLLIVLFTILLVEYFYRFAHGFSLYTRGFCALNLVFYSIIPTFNFEHYWFVGVILLLGCN